MQTLQTLQPILQSPKRIVITTHQNPDADALGSSLGLYHAFMQQNHEVTVVSSTFFPNFLKWMPGAENIIIFENDASAVKKVLEEADVLFCLDFNVISRTATLAEELKTFEGTKVLIDHHLFPDKEYFTYGLSNAKKSSTCEMIFDYLQEFLPTVKMNKTIAECLYSGVMTDTGGFRFSCTAPSTHRMVASLMEAGAIPHEIANQIFDNYEEKRLRLLGHLLSNCLKIYPQQQTALIYINKEDAQKYEVGQGDGEGIVNYPLSLQNVQFAAMFTEKDNEIRISFRSKNKVDVNTFARTYFNGGGHLNASGGKSILSLADTIAQFEKNIKEYQTNIIK